VVTLFWNTLELGGFVLEHVLIVEYIVNRLRIRLQRLLNKMVILTTINNVLFVENCFTIRGI
jgi:hypothetical protein